VISDVTVAEGNIDTTPAVFTVTLSSPQDVPVTFDYKTADNTAVAGVDYVTTGGTIVIQPGLTTATIPVPVIGNTVYQTNRNFAVQLSNVINKTAVILGGSARGIIVDDDPKPSISAADVAVVEGNSGSTTAIVTVTLTGATSLPATVNYATADGTAVV